jgi:hypothetical protein
MRAGDNYVLFKTDALFNDKVKIQGNQIYFDPSFDPHRHVRIYGEVTQIPVKLKKIPIMQTHRGVPDYHDQTPFEYKYVSDIAMDVQVGDRIYFHFNIIMKLQANLVKEIKAPGSSKVIEWHFKVRYDQILVAVRNGQIVPIGSYVLVEPDMESLEEILIPIAATGADGKPLRDHLGQPIMKPKDQWLQRKEKPTAKHMRGYVRHIGSPLIGDECEIKLGQMIYYRPNADWQIS